MGSHPCGRRAAWLGACALLAVQITVTGLASAQPASAATARQQASAAARSPAAPDTARRRAGASGASPQTTRVRAMNNSLPATRYAADATRMRPGAAKAPAQAGRRAAGMVSPVLWRRHRLFRAVRLQHPQAARRLRHAGLGWRSSGNCASRHRRSCTSLDTVRLGTLWGIVNLKRRSGCPVVVTGGTEVGHANGVHSHGRGYKLDIEHNKCIDRFIRRKRSGRVRGDGARVFYERRPQGHTVYASEPSHWDITFL